MISLKELKRLTYDEFQATDAEYLKVQSYFEGYLKRLLFISLRLNGIKYSNCQEIVTNAKQNLNLTDQLEVSFSALIGHSYSQIKFDDPELDLLQVCILRYCRPIRNKISHGADYKIQEDILRICTWATQEFVKKIESHLHQQRKLSAFDKPREWGAKKIGKKEIPTPILKQFGFRIVSKFDTNTIRKHFKNSNLNPPY